MRKNNVVAAKIFAPILVAAIFLLAAVVAVLPSAAASTTASAADASAQNLVRQDELISSWQGYGWTYNADTNEFTTDSVSSERYADVPIGFGDYAYYKNTATGKYVRMQSIAYKMSYTYRYSANCGLAADSSSGVAGYAWHYNSGNGGNVGMWMWGYQAHGSLYGQGLGNVWEHDFSKGVSKDEWLTVEIEVTPDYTANTTKMDITVGGEKVSYTFDMLGDPIFRFDTENNGADFKDLSFTILSENIDVNSGVNEVPSTWYSALPTYINTISDGKVGDEKGDYAVTQNADGSYDLISQRESHGSTVILTNMFDNIVTTTGSIYVRMRVENGENLPSTTDVPDLYFWECEDGTQYKIHLRVKPNPMYLMDASGKTIEGSVSGGYGHGGGSTFGQEAGKYYDMEYRIVDGKLSISVNGITVSNIQNFSLPAGKPMVGVNDKKSKINFKDVYVTAYAPDGETPQKFAVAVEANQSSVGEGIFADGADLSGLKFTVKYSDGTEQTDVTYDSSKFTVTEQNRLFVQLQYSENGTVVETKINKSDRPWYTDMPTYINAVEDGKVGDDNGDYTAVKNNDGSYDFISQRDNHRSSVSLTKLFDNIVTTDASIYVRMRVENVETLNATHMTPYVYFWKTDDDGMYSFQVRAGGLPVYLFANNTESGFVPNSSGGGYSHGGSTYGIEPGKYYDLEYYIADNKLSLFVNGIAVSAIQNFELPSGSPIVKVNDNEKKTNFRNVFVCAYAPNGEDPQKFVTNAAADENSVTESIFASDASLDALKFTVKYSDGTEQTNVAFDASKFEVVTQNRLYVELNYTEGNTTISIVINKSDKPWYAETPTYINTVSGGAVGDDNGGYVATKNADNSYDFVSERTRYNSVVALTNLFDNVVSTSQTVYVRMRVENGEKLTASHMTPSVYFWKTDDGGMYSMQVRAGGLPVYLWASNTDNGFVPNSSDGGYAHNGNSTYGVEAGKYYDLEYYIVDNKLSLFINGTAVSSVQNFALPAGSPMVGIRDNENKINFRNVFACAYAPDGEQSTFVASFAPESVDGFEYGSDLSEMTFKVCYSDGSELTGVAFSDKVAAVTYDAQSISRQKVKLTYTENGTTVATEFNLTLADVSLGYEMRLNKTQYCEEQFDEDSISFVEKFASGAEKAVEDPQFTVTSTGDFDAETAGEYTITVSFGGEEYTAKVHVIEDEVLKAILVLTKTEYLYGEEFSLAGAELKLVWRERGELAATLTGATVSGYDKTVLGTQNITLSVGDNSFTGETLSITSGGKQAQITVVDAIQNATLTGAPATIECDTDLPLSEFKISAEWLSGKSEQDVAVTAEMVSGYNKTAPGNQSVKIMYGGYEITLDLTVTDKVLSVKLALVKTSYVCGEDLELGGATLTVTYKYGSPSTVDLTNEQVSGYNKDETGVQPLTVTYNGKTYDAGVEVTVTDPVTQLTLSLDEAKTHYALGEEIDCTGIMLTATYASGATEEFQVTADMLSSVDKNSAGEKKVTVSYGGKTAQFTVVYESDEDDGGCGCGGVAGVGLPAAGMVALFACALIIAGRRKSRA